MKSKTKNIIAGLILTLLVPVLVSGQVLEVDPEEMKPVKEKVAHTGSCYTGSSGLATMPTPDFHSTKAAFSYKSGTTKQDIVINNVKTDVEKDEYTASARYNIKPNLELSVIHMKYERKSDPVQTGLNFKEDTVAFGMKYSAHNGEKDMCMGFTFAPMTAEELNLADIEQIENMRNVYLTIAEPIAENFNGFLNLTAAFTKEQKIDLGNGVIQEINRKDMLIGGFGLEYNLAETASVFCEYKVGNYRDIFIKDSVRHRVNAGVRIGTGNIQAEVLGLNLSDGNPTAVFGGSLAF